MNPKGAWPELQATVLVASKYPPEMKMTQVSTRSGEKQKEKEKRGLVQIPPRDEDDSSVDTFRRETEGEGEERS